MGSVIEGEDVVQDAFARAFVALDELEEAPPLRAWLFRIAHNRALDMLRSRAVRAAEPIEAAYEVADSESPDPMEALMRREAVETAVSRFVELPTVQRSVVILKDVLDQSLVDIAALLDSRSTRSKPTSPAGGPGSRSSTPRRRLSPHRARRHPPSPALWPCSTCATGTDCGRCWPTTSD
jgi:RNA polymerase sigma factor (sigma-70 family)